MPIVQEYVRQNAILVESYQVGPPLSNLGKLRNSRAEAEQLNKTPFWAMYGWRIWVLQPLVSCTVYDTSVAI